MSELSSRTRALLESARRAPCAPDTETIERMERAIVATAVGAGLGVAGAKAATSLSGKLLGALLVGGVVAGSVTTVVLTTRRERTPAPAEARKVDTLPTPPEPLPMLAPAPPEQVIVPPTSPPRTPAASRGPRAAPVKASAPAVEPAEAPRAAEEESALAAELGLLRLAQGHVDAHQWDAALEVLARHRERFPAGPLAVEADVLRVLSLCGVGRLEDASKTADALRAARAPSLRRLQGSCVDP